MPDEKDSVSGPTGSGNERDHGLLQSPETLSHSGFDVQADAAQRRLNWLSKNRTSVLGRTDQVIEQNRNIVALMDVFTHAPS